MKTCTQCGETAPLAEFGRNIKSRDGHRAACRACHAARARSRYKASEKAGSTITLTCEHCGTGFSYVYRSGRERMYCGDLCKYKAGEAKKLACGIVVVRKCGCGSTNVARTGKPVCPDCKRDRRDPERARLKERRRTLRKYGITEADWQMMLSRQGGVCAICRTDQPGGRGERWHIDHCHVTNEVRGLLCHGCNVALGHFHDDPQVLVNAMRYLGVNVDDLVCRRLTLTEAG